MNVNTLNSASFPLQLFTAPLARSAAPGKSLVDLNTLNLWQQFMGSERGYQTEGDLLYPMQDGVDPNSLWAEFQATLEIHNARRQTIVNILTFPVTQLIETVPDATTVEFQKATEFGVPKAVGIRQNYFQMGYDFEDFDLATRYTWKYLRDADLRQIEATHKAVLEADNRLIFRHVMAALFDNRNRVADIRNRNYNVFALYNGDGTVPPKWKNTTFDGNHSHYLVSGSATFDSQDLENATNHIAHHGFNAENGTQFVHILNSAQMAVAKTFRAGATINGVVCNYDFIPAPNQPTLFVPNAEGLLGERPPTQWRGLPVIGSYGNALLVEEDYIPPNYILTLGTGGLGDLQNPVGLREHAQEAYRGLRLIPGNQQAYPLIDSYYARAFGTGIRQRATAVITQIKASGTYDRPADYDRDLMAA